MKYSINYGVNIYKKEFISNNLSGCVNDAKAMHKLSDSCGYQSTLITDSNVTYNEFTSRVKYLANKCVDGDWVMITFSGHGTYVDRYGIRYTGICLHDGVLWDNDFKSLLQLFDGGVNVIWVCDCCYAQDNYKSNLHTSTKAPKVKYFDIFNSKSFNEPKTGLIVAKDIKCNIVNYGSSTLSQVSYDLGTGSLFTNAFVEVFNKKKNLSMYKYFIEVEKVMSTSGLPQNPVFSITNGVAINITYAICF